MPRQRMPTMGYSYQQIAEEDFVREIESASGAALMGSNAALGRAIGMNGQNIGNYKKRPDTIQMGTMRKIVKAIKPKPIVVLRFLGYSTQDIRNFVKENGGKEEAS